MKYTVSWIKESAKGNTNGRDWIKYEITLKDEQGVETTCKTFDNIDNGTTVEGEITHDPKWGSSFKKAQTPKQQAGANFKSQQIEKTAFAIQDKKSESIAKAQDRSAWMWAKTNASTVLANHPSLQQMPRQDIAEFILDLATKIYNGEPTEPFSS